MVIFTRHSMQNTMITFIGEYDCKADTKGRILLPAAFVRQLPESHSGRFVVKRDLYADCLEMFPIEEWDRQERLLVRNLNPYDPEHRQIVRDFHMGACEVTLDASKRFLLTARLLKQIGAERDVTLLGSIGKIEIWNPAVYRQNDATPEDKAERARRLMQHATYNLDDL